MSGIKKLMHKVKDKLDIGESHHSEGHTTKETWPGVDQTGNGGTGTAQDVRQGVGQTTAPSPGKPVSLPGTGTEKATDASRLVDAPPTFQNTGMAPTSNFSGATGTTPKVMIGEPKGNTDPLGKSDVYSPLGSSAHESVAAAKPKVTDVGAAAPHSRTMTSGGQAGSKGQQPFTGSLPHVGEAPKQPKLDTTNKDPLSAKTGTGAPQPMTHIKDIDHSANLTTNNPLPSAFKTTGTGVDNRPGSHVDELKDAKAKAGSAVNRSTNLTGDADTLGRPAQDTAAQTNVPKIGGLAPGVGEPNPHVAELKDAKAKAGSAVNRQPNLTGDISELGKPAQEATGAPKPLVGDVSPAYTPKSKDTLSKGADKGSDKDYTTALDRIADDKPSGTETAAGTGVLAAAADYVHSGARTVADTAHQYTDADDGKSGTKAAQDTVADKTQAAKDTLTPDEGTGTNKSLAGQRTASGKRVTTPPDEKSYVQQAKEGIAAAAAVTAEKAQQAYQVVQEKAYETGIPQKLGEHANIARDTAAAIPQKLGEHTNTARDAVAAKYDDLSTQAQKHHAAVRDVAQDRLATAKAKAQDYAQSVQQQAADHMDRVRNASPEDINHSSLGRMAGGIALLWLASYAVGIPFKYGLAGALLAISAVLFAEWDQGSRARRSHRTGASSSSAGDGPDSIPKFGTIGGIDAKTGAPPGSIHETSIGDISSGAKQNFPQDPISQGIGGTGAGHASHGAASFGGSGLGSDSGAGPTVTTGSVGESADTNVHQSSFYHSTEPALKQQIERGTATGAGFDSTYRSTQPGLKVEQVMPTAAEKSRYATEE